MHLLAVLHRLHDQQYRATKNITFLAPQKSWVTLCRLSLQIWPFNFPRRRIELSPKRKFLIAIASNYKLTISRTTGFIKVKHVVNPYEFEPGTPYVDDERQTTITDFMDSNDLPSPNTRASHTKNSRSEGNAMYMTQKTTPLNVPQSKSIGHTIQRSESSPPIGPHRSPQRHNRSQSPDISAYYAEDEESPYQTRRGRTPSRVAVGQGPQYRDGNSILSRRAPLEGFTNQDLRSPPRLLLQKDEYRSSPKSASPSRYATRSPTKVMGDVSEDDEYDDRIINADPFLSPTPSSPKRRSRSPMKKMFGENGWLGRSPNEAQEGNFQSKKSSHGRKEKSSVMGKLRTRIEEFVSTPFVLT
jgi:hypothetical protein